MLDQNGRSLNFVEAIREALYECMSRDERVILIGEGVPDPKAIFSSTAGLRETFGPQRVFDMPLAENGLTGACIGAALCGMRPVMVHQRIDFAMLAMDQIVNNAAKWHYMFDGKASVPLVIRMIVGRGWGQGPQHSQSLQAMFAQVPGLKVVMPTTARDAKGMLIEAIQDNNPVIFIEHRWLHNVRDDVPEGYYTTSLDKARLLYQGNEATIAAFSYMAFESLLAAKALAHTHGIHVDVLDMRSVRPLDVESVLSSVKRSGRLLVADTAFRTGSVAGELLAQVVEQAFGYLKAPPLRVASPDHPVPTSPFMAASYYPGAQTIVDTVLQMLGRRMEGADYKALREMLMRDRPHDTPHREFTGPF